MQLLPNTRYYFSTLSPQLSWIQYLSWMMYSNEAMTIIQWQDIRNISKWVSCYFLSSYTKREAKQQLYNFLSDRYSRDISKLEMLLEINSKTWREILSILLSRVRVFPLMILYRSFLYLNIQPTKCLKNCLKIGRITYCTLKNKFWGRFTTFRYFLTFVKVINNSPG